jgi:hypothetical protein
LEKGRIEYLDIPRLIKCSLIVRELERRLAEEAVEYATGLGTLVSFPEIGG